MITPTGMVLGQDDCWHDLDSEKLALSSLGEVRFSDETKEILKRSIKTWKGKTTYDRANKSTRSCTAATRNCS